MKITLSFSEDEWGRASLTGAIPTEEPCHALIYSFYKGNCWWAKSSNAMSELEYSAFYHHVYNCEQRQVIVNCGNIIQDCVIPKGYDPTHSQVADIQPLIPSVIYSCREHELGIILIPKRGTKSLRNKIWRLKESFMNDSMLPFIDALSHGRQGHRLIMDSESV
jgi:hypothetical protein